MAERHYFFIATDGEGGEVVVLDGDEFHHCVKVCRSKVGDAVALLDGRGSIYEARVERIGAREAVVRILGVTRSPEPSPVDIALGVLKAPRLDIALEKCTELGPRAFVLYASERSIRRAERDNDVRVDRMKRKLVAACKQSGQPYLPDIELLPHFGGLVERLSLYRGVFLADQEGDRTATDLGPGSAPVLGIVGPEGGLSPAERDELLRRGAVPLSLGPARLRSETAAICLLYRLTNDIRRASRDD
jgi:16S rRNA (uracil1498-N3)-methyltransferase